MYPKSQRRSPVFSDDPYMHYNHSNQEELYHRQPPPHYDTVGFEDHRRPSPLHNREDREGHRDGFREHSKGFNNWERSPKSPLRIHGEEFSSTSRFHSDHRPKEAKMGKRREEQGGSWKKCRDASPRASSRTETWDAGWGRGRRNCQSSNRERPRDESHRERSPVFKRQRGKLEEDEDPHGYRNKAFEEQHYAARDTLGRDARASSGPIIIEHDHGFRPHRKLSRGRSSERQDHGSDGGRPRGAHQAERYRMSGDRLDLWEDASGRRDDGRAFRYPDPRRNPAHHGTPNAGMLGKQKGKSGFRGRAQGGRAGPHGIQPRMPESSHGFPDVPQQEQSSEGQAFTEDHYKNPNSAEAERHEDGRAQPWMSRRSRSLEPSPPAVDLDPKMPRQRMLERNRAKPKNVTAVAEETMTIKVDMKRPVSKDSPLCYSSDRQLSLDLVNVGRQRLDFLPLLEHSGTYRETPTHTGTFAQEIITLVHHVKEQYFGGGGLTLNERFSAPQAAAFDEDDEAATLTLNQRFSANQGFSVNVNSLLDEEEPSSSSPSLLPPVRGPGDLRHDLERRRQERIEGVKVTIAGSGTSQRPLGPASKTSAEYREEEVDQMVEPEGFSPLPAHHRRQEFHMGSKRGGPSQRPFKAFQRRNYGIANQFRRQKRYNFPAGPNS